MKRKFSSYAPKLLRYDSSRNDFTSALVDNYFNGRIRKEPEVTLKNITQMITDFHFFRPVHQAATWHAAYAPVRLYLFAHMNQFSSYPFLRAANAKNQVPFGYKSALIQSKAGLETLLNVHDQYKEFGAGHGDELMNIWYFNSYYIMESDFNDDYNVSKSLVSTLDSFIHEE